MGFPFLRSCCCLVMLAMMVTGCSTVPQEDSSGSPAEESEADSDKNLSQEVAMGEKIHAHILSSFYPYTEPGMVQYLNKIGKSLTAHVKRKDLPYRFTLIYNEKIYATSSPGGFIYVTTGMINFLDNEAELAAVIAHEIGQSQFRDPRLSRSRKILDEITKTGTTVGPAFGSIGALAVIGLAVVHMAVTAQDKSPEERLLASDRQALHYLVEAGYDPQALLDLLYKFLNAGEEILPYFFDYYQSRPITHERFQSLQATFSELPLDGKRLSTYHNVYQETTKGVREIYQV